MELESVRSGRDRGRRQLRIVLGKSRDQGQFILVQQIN
jgi:hypothetical protein